MDEWQQIDVEWRENGDANVWKKGVNLCITFGDNRVAFSPHVKTLGAFIDPDLSMSIQVNRLIQSMYMEMGKIGKICLLITTRITELLTLL